MDAEADCWACRARVTVPYVDGRSALLFKCGCCFGLGTVVILPEVLFGVPLILGCVLAAALAGTIFFNLAAAVLRSPGTLQPRLHAGVV
ncbi:hypothetical protein WJX81_004407 [Elliptochloris bilobata]|uniref:DUF983 domain-containing protein n=1 Tax=Elliptochloris bilobata TaxID=381761 RepID=A0AAW1RBA2_9CHLO